MKSQCLDKPNELFKDLLKDKTFGIQFFKVSVIQVNSSILRDSREATHTALCFGVSFHI